MLPEHFFSPDETAAAVWTYWSQILKTDKTVSDLDEVPDWETMDSAFKTAFIEAINNMVTRHIVKYANGQGQQQPIPCYVCSQAHVGKAGQACSNCVNSILQRGE